MSQEKMMDVYQIRVQGKIDAHWESWLNGMTIVQESEDPPVTRISGVVIDQAKLRGIINQLWDLNLTLISVYRKQLTAGNEPEMEEQNYGCRNHKRNDFISG